MRLKSTDNGIAKRLLMVLSVLTKGHKATYIASLLQVDEKRINIGGVRHWLHQIPQLIRSLICTHMPQQGSKAVDAIGILTRSHGILCHAH